MHNIVRSHNQIVSLLKEINEDARLFKLFNNIIYLYFKIKPEKTLDVIISIF